MKKHTKSVTISLRISQVMNNFLKKMAKQITVATKTQVSKGELIRCFIIDEMDRDKENTLSLIKDMQDLDESNPSNGRYKLNKKGIVVL